jgi:hypothetical protein
MVKKKILFMSSLVYFSCCIHGMDGETPARQDAGSGSDKKPISHRNSRSGSQSTDDDFVISVSDPVSFGGIRGIIHDASGSSKNSVANKQELRQHIASTRELRQRNISASQDQQPSPITSDKKRKKPLENEQPQKRQSLLPKAIAEKLCGADLSYDGKTMYTEQQVWVIIEHFNRPVFELAMYHEWSIEQLLDKMSVNNEVEVNPQALLDHLHQTYNPRQNSSRFSKFCNWIFGDPHQQQLERMNKAYARMKVKESKRYDMFALELIKDTEEEAEGRHRRSALNDAHIALLSDQNNDQASTINQQWIAIIAQFVGTMGAAAWALYGQINSDGTSGGSGGNCTGS